MIVLIYSSSSVLIFVLSGNECTDSRGTLGVLIPRLDESAPCGPESNFVLLFLCRLFES